MYVLSETTFIKNNPELIRILSSEDITTVYQPIVSLQTGNVIGYESLSRGPINSALHFPNQLFEAARLADKTSELETLCRKKAIHNAMTLDKNKLLFININPDFLCEHSLKKQMNYDFLSSCDLDANQIVFEMTEKYIVRDLTMFKDSLAYYTTRGYNIAIDDMGSGYSGLNLLSKVRPHFIKIDMELVRGVDKNSFNQSIIEALVHLAKANHIKLIAEGIETVEELIALINLGVYAGQGYLLGKPSPHFEEIDSTTKQIIPYHYHQKTNRLHHYTYNYIGEIAQTLTAFPSDTKCDIVKQYLEFHDELGCCIINDDKPVGLMMRHTLDAKLATLYGISIFTNRPVALAMDPHPITVDYNTSILDVSKMAMNRPMSKVYDYIIVTKDSFYYGIVTVKSLLEYTTMIERNFARELNPLTALPGNRTIQNRLKTYMASNIPCGLLYLDLDYFKAYNDIYGFENGDLIIKYTADLITSLSDIYCNSFDFIGHIGGDDFICIIEKPYDTVMGLCEKIVLRFDEGIVQFFSKTDLQNGCILGINRMGIQETFPLTCLSIAGLYGRLNHFHSLEDIGAYMAKLKKQAKKILKSSYIIEKLE